MNQQNILLLEGDENISELISESLSIKGYNVEVITDGLEGISRFKDSNYDLVILNINMEKIDGFTICKLIRKKSDIPIIIISTQSDEQTQLMAYDLGCDDFLEIPFSFNILAKKVAVLLRRSSVEIKGEVLKYGDVELGLRSYTVMVEGKNIELTLKEFNILKILIQKYPQVISRENLLDSIWGYDFFGDSRIIDAHIKNIRKKLGRPYIKTVKGIGYTLEKLTEI